MSSRAVHQRCAIVVNSGECHPALAQGSCGAVGASPTTAQGLPPHAPSSCPLMRTLRLALCSLYVLATAATSSRSAAGSGNGLEGSHPGQGRPPITMAEFKEGMLHAYSTARDAFAALDASLMDLDAALDENPLDINDFVHGTRNFKPPLNEEQAIYAFRGLDVNNDGSLDSEEFIDGLKFGGFFRPTTTTTWGQGDAKPDERDPITMDEFNSRMFRVYSSAPDAFAALDASETDLYAAVDQNPVNLKQFIHGTQSFDPPLTRAQAEFAFRGLDADDNGILVSAEFAEGLTRGKFHRPSSTHSKRVPTTTTLTTTTITTATTTTTTRTTSTTTRTTTESTTTTSITTRTTTTLIPVELLPTSAIITMDEFKTRMLNAHTSALSAFQALDANPAGLDDFIRGTKTFKPPLTDEQAVYAFRGLDVDHDNSLPSFEFFKVLHFGRFFPKLRDIMASDIMAPSSSAGRPQSTTPHRERRSGAKTGMWTTTTGAPGPRAGVDMLKAVVLVTACPLLCLLLPVARAVLRCLVGRSEGLETYKAVGPHSSSMNLSSSQRRPQYSRVKRSRFFGSGGLIGCCIRSSDENEEPPLLCTPCTPPLDRLR